MCNKYKLDAAKIYDKFESSEVTGKRDFEGLKADLDGFYSPYNENELMKIDFAKDNDPVKTLVKKENVRKR